MKGKFKNTIVGFLIGVMLISSMGFSVNTMYCFCMGEYEVSLFEIEHQCNKEEEPQTAVDISHLHPCCQKAMREKACAQQKKEHKGCTKHDKKYFKADLKFTEFHKTEMPETAFLAVEDFCLPSFPVYSSIRFISEIQAQIIYRPPPPQYYGRKLLNFIQVYRC